MAANLANNFAANTNNSLQAGSSFAPIPPLASNQNGQ